MKKPLKCIAYIYTILLINTLPVFAEQSDTQVPKESKQAEKPKQDLGEWWHRNPLTYESLPQEFLYHAEATYDWRREKGNFTNDKHNLSFSLTLRKKIFSYHLRYSLDKRNASRPYSPPYQDDDKTLRKSAKHETHHDFRVALTDRIIASIGMFWLKDDFVKIENQYTYYSGLGYTIIRHPQLRVSIFGGYGYEERDHTDEYHEYYLKMQDWGKTTGTKYDAGTETAGIIYLNQTARCYVMPSLALNETVDYYVDNDESSRYRWKFNMTVDFKLMENLFVSSSYNEDYNNMPETLLGIRKRDISIGTGVKITF